MENVDYSPELSRLFLECTRYNLKFEVMFFKSLVFSDFGSCVRRAIECVLESGDATRFEEFEADESRSGDK